MMLQFVKDLLLKDLPLKLVSLALAIALWATVASVLKKNEQERARGETMNSNKQFQGVPVAVVFTGGDATGYTVKPAKVTVFIQGTPEAITALSPASVQAQIDLTYWDGRANLPMPVQVISPAGTAMVSVSPAEVEVVPPEPRPTTSFESGLESESESKPESE
ncbi:MAG: CdaR family protein [Verrucomicrobia bacterium]|nr:CdaR family protein [Verrucomicrobiota bacterium]